MKRAWFTYGWTAVVLAALVAGLYLSGSPKHARAEKYDQQRLQDLQQITFAVSEYARQNTTLPPDLSELKRYLDRPDSSFYLARLKDPRSSADYEYRPSTSSTYELCATFETDNRLTTKTEPLGWPELAFWQHGLGRTCFTLNTRKHEKVGAD